MKKKIQIQSYNRLLIKKRIQAHFSWIQSWSSFPNRLFKTSYSITAIYKNEFYKKCNNWHHLGIEFWPWLPKLTYENPVVSMVKSIETGSYMT